MLEGTRVNLETEGESLQRDLNNVGPRCRQRNALLAIMNCASTISDENAWFWLVSPWANAWPLHEICDWSRVQALAYSSDPLLCFCSRPNDHLYSPNMRRFIHPFAECIQPKLTYCIALFEVRCASKQYRTRRNRVATPGFTRVSRNRDHDLSNVLAGRQVLISLRSLVKREHLVNDRVQLHFLFV